jgi:hypothetical protein
MTDPALVSIARAAERGESYGLSLLTSDGGIFNGFTQPVTAFLDHSAEPLANEGALAMAGGRPRKAGDHMPHVKHEVTNRLEALRAHLPEGADVLTLAPAEWTPQHGQFQIRFPVVRVPLSGVITWWLVGGDITEQVRQGGSWFVGGIFPLGN